MADLPKPDKTFNAEQLAVEIYADAVGMGRAAAAAVAPVIKKAIDEKGEARVILATGNSQFSFIEALVNEHDIPWDKVTGFHMDEYVGIDENHPASFRRWMKERVVATAHPKAFNFLQGDAPDPEAECERYASLLKEKPIDVTCMGIGENGHVAFNDPPVADFNDPKTVKVVDLDEACKKQQVGEGHFPSMDSVPTQALSLTIPTLLSAGNVFVMVPDSRKSEAVYNAINGPIATSCPASILRQQAHARLYLDKAAAERL
jgi:glucosamine-6-phosphate deaminase